MCTDLKLPSYFLKVTTSLCILIWLGQPVDGPHNGPAPGPWDIPVPFREVFKNETQFREVPHTAYVKVNVFKIIKVVKK